MKPWLAVVVLMMVQSGVGQAMDIKDKWGVGVRTGTFIGSDAEVSLIRGHSERTAWILDLAAGHSVQDLDVDYKGQFLPPSGVMRSESGHYFVGPRLRSYTHPDGTFSPYWDLFLHWNDVTQHQRDDPNTRDFFSTGADLGLDLGAEYFTPWHFSVAAHTGVASVAYSYSHQRDNAGFGGQSREIKGSTWSASAGVSPVLHVRVYF
jgi:hypothetical protein